MTRSTTPPAADVIEVAPAVRRPLTPSRRACEAACAFGLNLEREFGSFGGADENQSVRIHVAGGRVVLALGPSGSGKSTFLKGAADALEEKGWRCVHPMRLRLREAPLVDLFAGSLEDGLRCLGAAGLAEAAIFVKRPGELSDGERHRLRLALALDRATRSKSKCALILDEFGAVLDRETARSVAHTMRRSLAKMERVCALVATAHDDIKDVLSPDTVIQFSLAGGAQVDSGAQNRSKIKPPARLRDDVALRPGSLREHRSLSAWHYRAGDPATCAYVLIAEACARGEIVGSLVVSMPTLHGAWRKLAWPGRYNIADKRLAIGRLNEEVRCISRVVVDPRWRGRGLAQRLVATYLAHPLTVHTEAVAAMGRVNGFFERAGMTAYRLPTGKTDSIFLDAMEHAGVEAWRLATPNAAMTRARAHGGETFVKKAVEEWASRRLRTGRAHGMTLEALFELACASAGAALVGYAHTAEQRELAVG